MKKILLIILFLFTLGCSKEKEVIKYRLTDKEKIVVELKDNSNLHYQIDESFYITYNDELIGSVSFINQTQCNSIISTENLEIIKEDEHGFSYKEDNYHYLNKDNKVCVLINAKELDNLNKILDNIDVRIEENK
jgi:hypothetical protein